MATDLLKNCHILSFNELLNRIIYNYLRKHSLTLLKLNTDVKLDVPHMTDPGQHVPVDQMQVLTMKSIIPDT